MTSRSRKRYTAGIAVVAALALSGCTFHPGSAAVVNGGAISQSKLTDLVSAACSFSKASRIQAGGATPSTSTAYLRHVLLQDLITFRITDKAATQLHLNVSPAAIAKVTAQQTFPTSLSTSEKALLVQFFSNSARSNLQQAVIGAHLKDPSVMNADNVTPSDVQSALNYLAAFTAKQHVAVNPADGSWTGQALSDSDGSLSAPKSSAAVHWLALRQTNSKSVAGLPASQVCG